ncbi:hypothetical protein [Mesoterricola silvestris]|uniref:Lipoprotein SmpA/OmlA domain-containing protein n=1 Tax=Mesoterricola silvestris TaxID=2927979 RepID=A0AA48GFT7_9BACT|nr:hypothetical protein [Mesoterricola silvestris]BDU71921.1 hypothetical protein METEAL_10950 [Mesoterricola silvestris]
MRRLCLFSTLLLGLACAQPAVKPDMEAPRKGQLTLGSVQTKVVNGSTTKAQILEWFGSPNLATKTKEGEVWNYTRQGTAAELKASTMGLWFLVGGSQKATGFSGTSSYSFDLLLRFDGNDVVVDHKVMQTAF